MVDIRQHIRKIAVNVEGGYTNDPDDSGGETNHGITKFTARAYGYTGEMKDLTLDTALDILVSRFWKTPRFDQVCLINELIAMEMLDTGINMGPEVASGFLQRALNVLNSGATTYPDMKQDGFIGPMTLEALRQYQAKRGALGIHVLHNMLNAQQSVRYIELAEKRPKDEKYEFGWQANRVVMLDI